MNSKSQHGWTLLEMVLVCAIASIILGIGSIAWQRASANRQMDATVADLESGLVLARQTAQNRNGAYLTIVPPTTDRNGQWELFPGQKETAPASNSADANPAQTKATLAPSAGSIATHSIPRVLNVTITPANVSFIQFNTAGGIDSKRTTTDSDGNCTINVGIGGDTRHTKLTIVGMTGAVVKNVEH